MHAKQKDTIFRTQNGQNNRLKQEPNWLFCVEKPHRKLSSINSRLFWGNNQFYLRQHMFPKPFGWLVTWNSQLSLKLEIFYMQDSRLFTWNSRPFCAFEVFQLQAQQEIVDYLLIKLTKCE